MKTALIGLQPNQALPAKLPQGQHSVSEIDVGVQHKGVAAQLPLPGMYNTEVWLPNSHHRACVMYLHVLPTAGSHTVSWAVLAMLTSLDHNCMHKHTAQVYKVLLLFCTYMY